MRQPLPAQRKRWVCRATRAKPCHSSLQAQTLCGGVWLTKLILQNCSWHQPATPDVENVFPINSTSLKLDHVSVHCDLPRSDPSLPVYRDLGNIEMLHISSHFERIYSKGKFTQIHVKYSTSRPATQSSTKTRHEATTHRRVCFC